MRACGTLLPHFRALPLRGQSESESGQIAGTSLARWGSSPVRIQTDQVDRDSRKHVREVCLRQATVTAATDANRRNGLMDGTLDTGPNRIALLPLVSALFGAGLLHRVVNIARAQHQLPTTAGERVHCGRTGHGWQTVTGNRTTIESRPRSVQADQIVLVTPCGHVTRW